MIFTNQLKNPYFSQQLKKQIKNPLYEENWRFVRQGKDLPECSN